MDFLVLLESYDHIEEGAEASRLWQSSATEYLNTQGYNIPKKLGGSRLCDVTPNRLLFGKSVNFHEGDEYADENTKLVVLLMTDGKWRLVKDKKFIEDRRSYILSSGFVNLKSRPSGSLKCGKCKHAIANVISPCAENCPCCQTMRPMPRRPTSSDTK